jgi:hypothetical protein
MAAKTRRLLLTLDDHSDLVGLKLRGPEPGCLFIIEATATVSRFFQPAIDGIPSEALDSGDRGLVHAFNAESRNLIKSGAAVLKPIKGVPVLEQNVFSHAWHRYLRCFPHRV